MRRKKKVERLIKPDPLYDSTLVARFINYIMLQGKKSVARRVFYDALEQIKKETKQDPIAIFSKAVENISPVFEVKSRRVGGARYQVPREVRGDRRVTLALRWLKEAARSQKGKPMSVKLADEIIQASKNEGSAVKRKENMHKMAEANRAFAHFSW